MGHDEALAALAGHPHAWRFVELCAEENPDRERRDAYRALVVRLARGEPGPPPAVAVDYGTPAAGPCRGCPGRTP